MTSSSEDDMESTSDIMEQEANTETESILQPKSQEKYIKAYENFMNWKSEENVESFSENDFMAYFNELSEKLQPSTLWAIYSMLKSTIITKHDVDLKSFTNLTSLLKKLSNGYKSKKSKVFTSNNVEKFLNEAPDEIYLATKVALIFGISGACKGVELANITVDDIEKHNKLLLIKLCGTTTKTERTFVIRGEYTDIVQKYEELRPISVPTNRFFLNYQKGKCTKQVIGKNKFANMPKEIATYLHLPNAKLYTGRCFRRTSAALAAGSGGNVPKFKRQADDGCIEASSEDKCKVPRMTETIYFGAKEDSPGPSTSQPSVGEKQEPASPQLSPFRENLEYENQDIVISQLNQTNMNIPGKSVSLTFKNCSNVTLNFK